MNCVQLANRLEDYLDGYLGEAEAAACATHIQSCAACAAERSAHAALRAALQELEAPQPPPAFVDAAIARAVAQPMRPKAAAARRTWSVRGLVARRETWVGAALGGALAAGLAVLLLRPLDVPQAPPAVVALAMNETREVGILINSQTPLEGATIRIIISGGISVAGYEDRQEFSWQTTLDGGANLVSLPVIARAPGEARIVAIVEHAGKTKRVAVDLKAG